MDIPPLLLAFLLSISFNLLVFVFAYRNQTDHYTDITYAATFMILASYFYYIGDTTLMIRTYVFLMVLLWAFRLGAYLKIRINKTGKDDRFDEIRPNFLRYMRFWILQGSSVWIIAIPTVIFLSLAPESLPQELPTASIVGLVLWVFGFMIETIADYQKFTFKSKDENEGEFMSDGLYSIVRHPNYLGEMLVWIAVFLYTTPFIDGLQWLGIVSPIWICTLLLFISGIPMLEKKWDKKYGDRKDYQQYKSNTSRLIPAIY